LEPLTVRRGGRILDQIPLETDVYLAAGAASWKTTNSNILVAIRMPRIAGDVAYV
jgi:hypothetical protein